ncbi:PepSY domain-containing protein [Planomonospora alba]|uniref:PepSY domain-containing protein n=1 Tax=Planomonospora alba TaxID=161354 RepID=UPI0031F12136
MIIAIALATAGTAALPAVGGGAALAASGTAAAGSTAAASAPVTCRQAVGVARNRVPNARVVEVEREREDGRRVCVVELVRGNREYEVYVSRRTGEVVKFGWELRDWS